MSAASLATGLTESLGRHAARQGPTKCFRSFRAAWAFPLLSRSHHILAIRRLHSPAGKFKAVMQAASVCLQEPALSDVDQPALGR